MSIYTEEEEVRLAVEQFTFGLINADKAILEELFAEDLSYGHSGGQVETKYQVIEAFANGKYKFGKIDITQQTVQLFGDTAIVRHQLHATTADAGKTPGKVYLFIITVWHKADSKWQLIARQAIKDPAHMK